MKKKIALMYMLMPLSCLADQVVVLNIRQYPDIPKPNQTLEEQSKKLQQPGKIARKTIKALTRPNWYSGICALYGGYFAVSDFYGHITFPRLEEEPEIDLLVTNTFEPVMMAGLTVHHWQLADPTKAAMYHFKKEQDPETKAYYWLSQSTPLPENNRIPLNTIIVAAKPKNIYVPEGITMSNDNPQLILPKIYAKKGINTVDNALFVLTYKHFFDAPAREYKKEDKRYLIQFVG